MSSMDEIPRSWVRRKYVDYDAELLAFFGVPFTCGAVEIPPPAFGCFGLLEIIKSRYLAGGSYSLIDLFRVAYICCKRESCLREIQDWLRAGGRENEVDWEDASTLTEWDKKVIIWASEREKTPLKTRLKYWIRHRKRPLGKLLLDPERLKSDEFRKWFWLFANGYEMFPEGGKKEFKQMLYGADTQAQNARLLCEVYGVNWFEALWRIPVVSLGFAAIASAKAKGAEGIKRPEDDDSYDLIDRGRMERNEKGELHPWQIVQPMAYPIDKLQVERNPQIFAQFDEQRAWYLKVGHKAAMREWKRQGLHDLDIRD